MNHLPQAWGRVRRLPASQNTRSTDINTAERRCLRRVRPLTLPDSWPDPALASTHRHRYLGPGGKVQGRRGHCRRQPGYDIARYGGVDLVVR